jgi:predicted DNA binding CopG/RHH family protein
MRRKSFDWDEGNRLKCQKHGVSIEEIEDLLLSESDLDYAQFKPARFEFARKEARVNMRLPRQLLDAVKARAKARGIPYQRYIRDVLERAVQR